MRLSARQAWHDCFYVPKNDALARLGVLNGKSGKATPPRGKVVKIGGEWMVKIWEEDHDNPPGKNGKPLKRAAYLPMLSAPGEKPSFRDFFLSWDPMWRGRVAGVIKRMPPLLRAFGMMMYAPKPDLTLEDAEEVVMAIKAAFYDSQDPKQVSSWQGSRILRIHYMIHAALHFYRKWIFDGGEYCARPVQIGNYIRDQFVDRIPNIEDHWQRDWQSVWSALITIIDEFEALTLTPVAAALAKRKFEVEPCPDRELENQPVPQRPVICGPKKLVELDDMPPRAPLPVLSLKKIDRVVSRTGTDSGTGN